MPFPLLRSAPLGDHYIFGIHVFRGLAQYIDHRLQVVLVDREKELSKLQPIGECSDESFVSASSIKRAFLLKRVTYDLRLSSSHCLMFNRLAEDLLYLCPLIK